MRSPRIPIGILLLLTLLTVLSATSVPNGRASSPGLVCIASHGSTSCPTTQPTITGTKNSLVSLDVIVQASNSMNGFDIVLFADHTVLLPVSVTLGNVLLNPSVELVCIGGRQTWPPPNIISQFSCTSIDTADTVEMIATSGPSSPLTNPPTTGLLFTATYNVTGTASTAIPAGFQTGCSPSSISGTTTCIDIANGSLTPVPENAQGARFLASQTQTLTLSFNGVTFALTASLANDTSFNLLVGTVQVTATNQTNGQTIFSKSYYVNVSYPGKNQVIPAARTLRFVLLANSLGDGILCSASPASAPTIQCFATYNPDVFSRGQIDLVDVGAVALAYGSTPGTKYWNLHFDFDLDGYIGIQDVGVEFANYGSPLIT